MYIGKMTATWLILVVIVGCLIVPLMIIYLHSIHPYLQAHPNAPHVIIGMVSSILPDVSLVGPSSGVQL